MSESFWTCSCGVVNALSGRTCEVCGLPRAGVTLRTCPVEGHPLDARGFCERGQGWPEGRTKSPFVCSQCRQFLGWDGKCWNCRRIEGGRFELAGHHWQLVEPEQPTRIFTREQNREALAVVRAVYLKGMTVAEGHATIDGIAR